MATSIDFMQNAKLYNAHFSCHIVNNGIAENIEIKASLQGDYWILVNGAIMPRDGNGVECYQDIRSAISFVVNNAGAITRFAESMR